MQLLKIFTQISFSSGRRLGKTEEEKGGGRRGPIFIRGRQFLSPSVISLLLLLFCAKYDGARDYIPKRKREGGIFIVGGGGFRLTETEEEDKEERGGHRYTVHLARKEERDKETPREINKWKKDVLSLT